MKDFIELTSNVDGSKMYFRPAMINGYFSADGVTQLILTGDTCVPVKESTEQIAEYFKKNSLELPNPFNGRCE